MKPNAARHDKHVRMKPLAAAHDTIPYIASKLEPLLRTVRCTSSAMTASFCSRSCCMSRWAIRNLPRTCAARKERHITSTCGSTGASVLCRLKTPPQTRRRHEVLLRDSWRIRAIGQEDKGESNARVIKRSLAPSRAGQGLTQTIAAAGNIAGSRAWCAAPARRPACGAGGCRWLLTR